MKISRKGVPRVVWERKKMNEDPDKPPTVDLIPFLSVSRSLGDFWSWSERTQQFVVSPQPDVCVHTLDPSKQRFIVIASDGLWNIMTPQEVVDFVWDYETGDGDQLLHRTRDVVRSLIDEALFRWRKKGMFADNISVVIAFLSQQETTPSMSGSSFASSSQPVDNEAAINHSDMSGGDEERAVPPVIHHVHTTPGRSTLYHKETLPGGAVMEEHTVISMRCRCKDKLRAKARENESLRLSEEGEGGSGKRGEGEEGLFLQQEEERSPVKRQREEGEEEEVEAVPRKRPRQERDSGCESDSGSPTAAGVEGIGETSSGVFSEDSCPETHLPGPTMVR